jgi:hypothetical protein
LSFAALKFGTHCISTGSERFIEAAGNSDSLDLVQLFEIMERCDLQRRVALLELLRLFAVAKLKINCT